MIDLYKKIENISKKIHHSRFKIDCQFSMSKEYSILGFFTFSKENSVNLKSK